MKKKSLENIMDELISVILPVYNGEKYLKKAIDSILNQSYQNFEFIIINDGSKDNSINIINQYAITDSRIRVINRKNLGLIATLNEAIEQSRGKYIARMDQDDISLSKRLQLQYDYMSKNNLDICGGDFIIINEKGKRIGVGIVPKTYEEIVLTLGFNVPFAHPSVLIKKEFLIKNKLKYGKDGKKYAEDLDMWMMMFNMGATFGNVNDEVLKYRIVSTSMSRVNSKKIAEEIKIQFSDFRKKNNIVYKQYINNMLTIRVLNKEQQKLLIRSFFALDKDNFNLNLFLKVLAKVKFINLSFVVLSEIKKWIKSK